jgi:hypothetical protein
MIGGNYMLASDLGALLWLVLALLMCGAAVYAILFPLFFYLCDLSGPFAIRLAWTAGLIGLFVYLLGISAIHASYLDFWRVSDPVALIAFLMLVVPASIFLAAIWLKRPRIV